MPTPKDLVLVSSAKQALVQASTIDEVKDVIDKAEAIRLYFRKAADGLEIQNQAAEIKLRAERRAGELLCEISRYQRGGDRRSKSRDGTLKLSDLKINKNQSSRWQKLAGLDEDTFEQHIATTKDNGRELTSAGTLKLAQKIKNQAPIQSCGEKHAQVSGFVPDLNELIGKETFSCIYADPPWPYSNEAARGAASNHYKTMALEEIRELPVPSLATTESHLHLWTTNAFLQEALTLIADWKFQFKSCLVWVKPQLGTGNYWRVSHEFLLLGVRNGLPFNSHATRSWVEHHRLRHSEKPEHFRTLVEQVSPGPYLELFGRKAVPGWCVWGNQVKPTDTESNR